MVVGLHADSPDDATLSFAFTEAALRGARLQVIAAYPWPVQTWSAPGQLVPPVIDQAAVEAETRVLAEGFLAPHRERHPDVRADAEALPGDAATASSPPPRTPNWSSSAGTGADCSHPPA